jgi:serine/threonine protein kinase/tetratricopeptide (TPR) repeat protein
MTGPTNSGTEAVESWSGQALSRVWNIGIDLDVRPSHDIDLGIWKCERSPGHALAARRSQAVLSLLEDFTLAWEQGHAPAVEEYLERLDPADCRGAVELIYREFCLAEAAGRKPDPSCYRARFPQHACALERLLGLHAACSPSLLGRFVASAQRAHDLPNVGDAIGPYLLRQELGRGGFARVFLAEQLDLENRPIVVKVTTRPTREPWLLARVRHSHIVEIVTHDMVDDGMFQFQLICMPFLGGATLEAVLAARRQDRPVAGRGLLADLDAVAIPGYPAVHPARPAREILAGLSYDQAIAWVGARLAEALDYAFSRHVAHGDVKPSNILLSADGNPMLLDFNLARDASSADGLGSHDPGGTIAYMAPERLRKLAARRSADGGPESAGSQYVPEAVSSRGRPANETHGLDSAAFAPHHADIYALGMVLLEATTGQPPGEKTGGDEPGSGGAGSPLEAAASAYAAARDRSASTVIREFELSRGRAIAPGLRVILERCIEPDPARRYWRARDLAEDLDRWRTNRPLVFTDEPFWSQTVPRVLRRQRRRLAVIAAAVSLLVGLPLTTAVLFRSLSSRHDSALFRLARLWDDADADAHRFARPHAARLLQPDGSHVAAAARALKEYRVTAPGDWRQRDDIRSLPIAEREDLELWLLEQAYLFCLHLDDRPGSRAEWHRALSVLDAVSGPIVLPALAPIRLRLVAKLRTEGTVSPDPTPRSPDRGVVPWINEYLLGVIAECDGESRAREAGKSSTVWKNLGTDRGIIGSEAESVTRRAAEVALKHYNNVLAHRPRSYWGHYRAACVTYLLGGSAELAKAATHLEQCLKRRPANSVLRGQLAACLMDLNQNCEALDESNKAIAATPDVPELYRTRAFIRTTLGPVDSRALAEDLQQFEILTRMLPRRFLIRRYTNLDHLVHSSIQHDLPFGDPVDVGFHADYRLELDGEHRRAEIDPEELAAREALAERVGEAGEYDLAALEVGKILILDPHQLDQRMNRVLLSIETHRFDEAKTDLDTVLNSPGLLEHIQKYPAFLKRFHRASRRYCAFGKFFEAREIARRALDFAIALGLPRGESHYNLARAYAISARTESQFIARAADQLFKVFAAEPLYRNAYVSDREFGPLRCRIDAELHQQQVPAFAMPPTPCDAAGPG